MVNVYTKIISAYESSASTYTEPSHEESLQTQLGVSPATKGCFKIPVAVSAIGAMPIL